MGGLKWHMKTNLFSSFQGNRFKKYTIGHLENKELTSKCDRFCSAFYLVELPPKEPNKVYFQM